MEEWPDGLRLFGQLRELPAPLRLPDLDAWIRSLGCSPFPVPSGTFHATPMRHRGMVSHEIRTPLAAIKGRRRRRWRTGRTPTGPSCASC